MYSFQKIKNFSTSKYSHFCLFKDLIKNFYLKNNCFVKFPEILDISNLIDKDCGFNGDAHYFLYALINHTGTISSGHYYSYVMISNSEDEDYKWFEFNDDKVLELAYEWKENAYLYSLFYMKK